MSLFSAVELKDKLKEMDLPPVGSENEMLRRLLEAGVPAEELMVTIRSVHDAPLDAISDKDVEGRHERLPQPETPPERLSQPETFPLTEVDLLRRERELDKREIELLRKELEISRKTTPMLQSEENCFVQTRIRKWKDIKDLVSEFDGNNLDYDRWEKQVKKLLSSYELDCHEQKALVCSRLTHKALRWYYSRVDCVDLTCENLLEELRKMYSQRPDAVRLRHEFEGRIWRIGETFSDYLHEKVTLGNRVPVSELEMISYVIEGIQNEMLRTQAKVHHFESIDALQTAFANVPAPKDPLRRPLIQRPENVEKNIRTRKSQKQEPMEPDTRKCYNCNESGHSATFCQKPKRERGTCFKCGKFGHQALECRKQATLSGEVNYVGVQREEDDEI